MFLWRDPGKRYGFISHDASGRGGEEKEILIVWGEDMNSNPPRSAAAALDQQQAGKGLTEIRGSMEKCWWASGL